VSNYKRYEASGHRYFSLKDDGAQVRVVLFPRERAEHLREIRDGQTVIVTGSLGCSRRGGSTRSMPGRGGAGVGNLLLELERRKRRFAEEGLFDAARKRPLPRSPGGSGS